MKVVNEFGGSGTSTGVLEVELNFIKAKLDGCVLIKLLLFSFLDIGDGV